MSNRLYSRAEVEKLAYYAVGSTSSMLSAIHDALDQAERDHGFVTCDCGRCTAVEAAAKCVEKWAPQLEPTLARAIAADVRGLK